MATKKIPPKSQQQVNAEKNILRIAKLLKDKGVAFRKKDFRSAKVTDYMRRRVKQLAGVLTGEAEIVRGSSAQIRSTKGDETVIARGRDFVVVPSDGKSVSTFRGKMRAIAQPLRDGTTIERLVVPGGAKMSNVLRFLESGSADALKLKREWFAFRFEDYASPRVFTDAKSLYDFLMQYAEGHEEGETEPKIYLYRIYPPGDWYRLVKMEAQDYLGDLRGEASKAKGRELRRVRFSIERQMAKMRKVPRVPQKTADEKRQAFLEKERIRNRKRQRNTETRRKQQRDLMRARRAKAKAEKGE